MLRIAPAAIILLWWRHAMAGAILNACRNSQCMPSCLCFYYDNSILCAPGASHCAIIVVQQTFYYTVVLAGLKGTL